MSLLGEGGLFVESGPKEAIERKDMTGRDGVVGGEGSAATPQRRRQQLPQQQQQQRQLQECLHLAVLQGESL